MSKRSKGPGYDLGQHVAETIANHFNGSAEGFFAAAKHFTGDTKLNVGIAVKAYETVEAIPWQAERLVDRILTMDSKEIAKKFGEFAPVALTKAAPRPTRTLEGEFLGGMGDAAPA